MPALIYRNSLAMLAGGQGFPSISRNSMRHEPPASMVDDIQLTVDRGPLFPRQLSWVASPHGTTLLPSARARRLVRSAEVWQGAARRWPSKQRQWDLRDGLYGPCRRQKRRKFQTSTDPDARRTTRELQFPDSRAVVRSSETFRRRIPLLVLLPNEPTMRL